MKKFLLFFITPFLFNLCLAETKPNIVFILADDLGWKDVGYNGATFYETPNIDRLASQGMIMNRFYPGAANCAPSRATMLTGMYMPRHSVYIPQGLARGGEISKMRFKVPTREQDSSFNTFHVSINNVDPAYESLAEMLKKSGYTSARIGKWHIGDDNQGFDFVSANGEPDFITNIGGDEKRYYDDIHVAEKMTDTALDFIEKNKNNPFFLYLAHWEVHTPIKARKERIDHFTDKQKSGKYEGLNPVYAAEVEQVDLSVGRVMKKLEELGLDKNTVVIFTSDNGGVSAQTSNLPLRAGKGTYYEGGIRVPFCIKWPGMTTPGSQTDVPVNGVDFMPTFAEIASAPLPEAQPVDGTSFVPLLKNQSFDTERPVYFHFPLYIGSGGPDKVLPAYDGTPNYWRGVPSTTMLSGDWKLIYYYEYDSCELYNLKKDISEKTNLAQKESHKTEKMLRKMNEWVTEVKAPVPSILNVQTKMTEEEWKAYKRTPSALNEDLPEKNLHLMTFWGDRPESLKQLYEYAYNKFSADKFNATFQDLVTDPKFQELCSLNNITHLGGPMLGQVSSSGASVWIRTRKPADVTVSINVNGDEKIFGPVKSSASTDFSAIVTVTGLAPGLEYPYKVLIDGNPIHTNDKTVIRTTESESAPTKTRIAFGTCFHQWGLGNQNQANLIRKRKPAAILLGGDIAAQDRNNRLGLHRADYLLRDLYPAWKSLVAEIPVYATWDDHDYFDNDLAGIPKGFTNQDKENVWGVFRHAWNNPSYGFGEKEKGVFFRTRIGPADVIMLDHRYFRTGKKGSFLGQKQMDWLKEQLLDCKGPFIILSNGTMWSDYVSNGKDSWGTFDPEGREELFSFIEKNNIKGVLLISGDRHGARGFTIPRPSGFKFYEFEAGSLGGRTGPAPTKPEWDTQFYGISGRYAFGEFEFDTTLSDPEVTFRLIDDHGKTIHKLTLTRSQLTPGN